MCKWQSLATWNRFDLRMWVLLVSMFYFWMFIQLKITGDSLNCYSWCKTHYDVIYHSMFLYSPSTYIWLLLYASVPTPRALIIIHTEPFCLYCALKLQLYPQTVAFCSESKYYFSPFETNMKVKKGILWEINPIINYFTWIGCCNPHRQCTQTAYQLMLRCDYKMPFYNSKYLQTACCRHW